MTPRSYWQPHTPALKLPYASRGVTTSQNAPVQLGFLNRARSTPASTAYSQYFQGSTQLLFLCFFFFSFATSLTGQFASSLLNQSLLNPFFEPLFSKATFHSQLHYAVLGCTKIISVSVGWKPLTLWRCFCASLPISLYFTTFYSIHFTSKYYCSESMEGLPPLFAKSALYLSLLNS